MVKGGKITPNAGEDVKQLELSCLVSVNIQLCNFFGKILALCYKTKHTLTLCPAISTLLIHLFS